MVRRYAEPLFALCILILAAFMLFTAGCGRPVDAAPPAETIQEAAPCTTCKPDCTCTAMQAKLEEAEGKLAKMEAALAEGADKYTELANDHSRVKFGDTIQYEGNTWKVGWVKVMDKPKKVQAPDPYMSPCGPGGCPTPSARGFRLFR